MQVLRVVLLAVGLGFLVGTQAVHASEPCACACACDWDEDQDCDLDDAVIVQTCVQTPGCETTDVDCNGIVEMADIEAVLCLLQGSSADRCCGACPCPCDCDMDGDGYCGDSDSDFVQCCTGCLPADCQRMDIDCNGIIDGEDLDAVVCRSQGGGPESCCGACPCDCDVDVDGDQNWDIDDLIILLGCIEDPTGECDGADINCDGIIDKDDSNALFCRRNGGSADDCCGACPCGCECDVDDNLCCDMDDYLMVLFCIGSLPQDCGRADLNCDGVINYQDYQAFLCAAPGPGGPHPECCGSCLCECYSDAECEDDGNWCTRFGCDTELGICVDGYLAGRPYGDVYPVPNGDGTVELTDVLCVLDAASGKGECLKRIGGFAIADIHPCGAPDGAVEIMDTVLIQDAAAGNPACPPMCP